MDVLNSFKHNVRHVLYLGLSKIGLNEQNDMQTVAPHSFDNSHYLLLIVGLACAFAFLILFSENRNPGFQAPIHGRRWWLEPNVVLRSRFTSSAPEIISSGYKKVPADTTQLPLVVCAI